MTDEIIKLSDLEHIRLRPSLYLGDVYDGSALHHSLFEIIDNSLDEALNGYGKEIKVTVLELNKVQVQDFGRGFTNTYNEKEKKYNIELAFESLNAGGKFNKNNYTKSSGLHGHGAKATNALSNYFKVETFRDKKLHTKEYSKGLSKTSLLELPNTEAIISGTRITFSPDDTIYKNIVTFDKNTIIKKLKTLSYLNTGIKFTFIWLQEPAQQFYCEKEGLLSYLKELDTNTKVCNPFSIYIEQEGITIDVALVWNSSDKELIKSYTNNTEQTNFGTHVNSVRSSLNKILLPYFKDEKIEVISDDIYSGLSYIISIYIAEPKFTSQTKEKLAVNELKASFDKFLQNEFKNYFEKNQFQTTKILDKIRLNAKAREASRKSKENVLKSSTSIAITKLAACSEKDPRLIELILVEGDSAGGSAKQGRNRKFQAILPLRGKILNVEKASGEKVQASKEINILKAVIGEFPNYNYHKVIIMTDADVDGSHIRTLLLTLFYRHMPDLIEQGYVYIGKPPLFKAMVGKQAHYILNERAMIEFQKTHKVAKTVRFKGLGEMNPEELWDTTLNPNTRTLERVTITDIIEAESCFNVLMGSDVAPRKDFIINSDGWKNLRIE